MWLAGRLLFEWQGGLGTGTKLAIFDMPADVGSVGLAAPRVAACSQSGVGQARYVDQERAATGRACVGRGRSRSSILGDASARRSPRSDSTFRTTPSTSLSAASTTVGLR